MVTYTDRAKSSEELLREASKQLEEAIGAASARVKAAWDRIEDEKGRPLYTLRIADGTASAQAHFTPDQLRVPTYVRVRMYHLWGDLLQVRSDAQGRKVQELIEQLQEG